jgi:SAM-dependent methyltransferase
VGDDVRTRAPHADFDLATLHNNIYYFPVVERVAVLRHVQAFLKPGGRLLVTTVCRGPGVAVDILNLWGAMTSGCGRLPAPTGWLRSWSRRDSATLAGRVSSRATASTPSWEQRSPARTHSTWR